MKNCQSCRTELMNDAAFCHNCGVKVEQEHVCSACYTVNPSDARFCFKCGSPIDLTFTRSPLYSSRFLVDFEHLPTLPTQLIKAFEQVLLVVLEDEQQLPKQQLFIDRLHSSDFRRMYLEEACVLLTQRLELLLNSDTFNILKAEAEIAAVFYPLFDKFFVLFCSDLTPVPLSKDILGLKEIGSEQVKNLIAAYIEPQQLPENFYFGAIDMPYKLLQNAQKSYYKPVAGEQPILLVNQSFFQFNAGKEGLLLSSKGIFWKSFLHKPAHIRFEDLKSIVYFPDRLELNHIYLNIDPAFNYSLYKLLTRLFVRFS
jgi:hypothetical protein